MIMQSVILPPGRRHHQEALGLPDQGRPRLRRGHLLRQRRLSRRSHGRRHQVKGK